jgi:hypothetical protein
VQLPPKPVFTHGLTLTCYRSPQIQTPHYSKSI